MDHCQFMIEKSASVSIKINQIIRERVKNGSYLPGSRLPSEVELAGEFGVSRSTLRIAVNSLVTEGVIIRKHGNGSFINQHAVQFNTQLQNLWSFPQLIRESGRTPEIRYLNGYFRQSTKLEESILELDSSQPVYFLQRLFLADSYPVIHSTNIIPSALFVAANPKLNTQLSIYEILSDYCSLDLIYSVSDLHAEPVPEDVNKHLQIGTNRSVIVFKDVFYTKESQPVVMGLNYYNDQILSLRLVRSKA
jgi:GntR family transcriptional regulator